MCRLLNVRVGLELPEAQKICLMQQQLRLLGAIMKRSGKRQGCLPVPLEAAEQRHPYIQAGIPLATAMGLFQPMQCEGRCMKRKPRGDTSPVAPAGKGVPFQFADKVTRLRVPAQRRRTRCGLNLRRKYPGALPY